MNETSGHAAFGISGKIALITGGSKNIGRSIAATLAQAGAVPVILYRGDHKTAQAFCDEIAANGGRAGMHQADLTDVAGLKSVVARIEKEFGGVDILVNNAAIRPNSKISEITVEEWDLVFATNLRAPFFLSQAVLPLMVRKKWGRIVNIGGTDAYVGKPRRAHGVSAKLGLAGLTRALAIEVAQFGVTVNTVVPGTIDTHRHHPEWYPNMDQVFERRKQRLPMGRLGLPQEVANAVLFLASELATYTTAQEFFVSGGVFPTVRQPEEEYPAGDF